MTKTIPSNIINLTVDNNADAQSSVASVVVDSNNLCLDFIVLMEPLPYYDANGRQKYIDITKPIRSPNRGNQKSQFTGIYCALQEKGNLKARIQLPKKSQPAEINAAIEEAIGDSKYLNVFQLDMCIVHNIVHNIVHCS